MYADAVTWWGSTILSVGNRAGLEHGISSVPGITVWQSGPVASLTRELEMAHAVPT